MDKREIKDKLAHGWLKVNIIFEIMGKPAEHVEKALEMLLEKLGEEKKIEVISKKTHKAKLIEKTKNVFTSFAEVEILILNLSRIIEIIFDYMPSSVEIIEPTVFTLKNEDANAMLNDLAIKLHQYDAISKRLKLERQILIKRLSEELKKKESKEKEEEK